MFEPNPTLHNFDFGEFRTWIGANNDHNIWFPRGWMSDFEQCSNWLLLNFSCEFGANNGQIGIPIGWMSDSDQCSNWLQLYLIMILVNFSCELGQIMARYDFIEARWMILSNVRTDSSLTWFHFGKKKFIWIWANNDQIWLPRGKKSDFEQMFELTFSFCVQKAYYKWRSNQIDSQITIYGCSNVSTALGESCENVGKLSCCNIFQENFKNVATMLPPNVVRKHLHNIMATFIHIFWQRRSAAIFTMLWQPFCSMGISA